MGISFLPPCFIDMQINNNDKRVLKSSGKNGMLKSVRTKGRVKKARASKG